MRQKRGLRYRLDKWSIYFPALAMAALALVTFWLARNAPSFVQSEEPALAVADPDYQLADFAVRNYSQSGRLTVEIHGDKGHHYPQAETLEVDNIQLRAIAENGRVTTASALMGTSNSAGTEMSLRGNARVVQEAFGETPRLEFQGDELLVWPKEERVRSDKPVTLLRGADRMTGDTLVYDKNAGIVEISGRVRGVLQAPGKSSSQ